MMTHPLLFEPLHARYQCHRCDRKFGATAPRVAQREKETQGNGLVTTLPKLCAVCYIAFPLMGILHCFLYIGTLGIDQDGFTGCDYAKDFFQFGGLSCVYKNITCEKCAIRLSSGAPHHVS